MRKKYLFGGAIATAVSLSLVGCGAFQAGNKNAVNTGTLGASATSRDVDPNDPDPNYIPDPEPVAGQFIVSVTDGAITAAGSSNANGAPTRAMSPIPVEETPTEAVPIQYTEPGLGTVASDLCQQYGGTVSKTYNGFGSFVIANLSEAQAKSMSHDSRVEAVEQDGVVEFSDGEEDDPDDPANSNTPPASRAVQSGPTLPWALDRIDQRNLPLLGTYTYNATGQGVNVYMLDSGINTSHAEFQGRATNDWSAFSHNYDDYGHGTATASIVGGQTLGVAKGVRLHSVKVLDSNNKEKVGLKIKWFSVSIKSSFIDGMNWVKDHHQKPAVVNMSAGTYAHGSKFASWITKRVYFPAVGKAVKGLINRGVIFVCSAGNDADKASQAAPSDRTEAIVVGSVGRGDFIAYDSNYGDRVDLFAPGDGVLGANYLTASASKTVYGTSFAAPHVAGVAAQYLQTHPTAKQTEVENWLIANSTPGKVNFSTHKRGSSVGSETPNRLLFTNQ